MDLPPPNDQDDPFRMSNDKFYLSKEGTESTNLSLLKALNQPVPNLRHAKVATELDDDVYGPAVSTEKLRHFHRPQLVFPGKKGNKFKSVRSVPDDTVGFVPTTKVKYGDKWKLKDLTGKAGRIIMAEYAEEHPPLLSRAGMCTLVRNYYRAPEKSTRPPQCDHGVIHNVGSRDASPFLGNLKRGVLLQSFENNMFRAPIYKHKLSDTDFLVIRRRETRPSQQSKGGKAKTVYKFYIRRVPAAYTVGQQCPKIEVPAPKSKKVQDYINNRLRLFIASAFEQAEKDPKNEWGGIKVAMIRDAFNIQDSTAENNVLREIRAVCAPTSIKSRLKELAQFEQTNSGYSNEGAWVWKPGVARLTESDRAELVRPEDVCAYESMCASILRLESMGYRKELVDKDEASAAENEDTSKLTAQDECRMAPWHTTADFIAHINKKCLLFITGKADPSGCGEGFAYLRKPNKPAVCNDATANKLRPQESVQFGKKQEKYAHSDKDLRKLKINEARDMLVNRFGHPRADLVGMERWPVINLVRDYCTREAGADGKDKFARGKKSTIAEYVDNFKKDCQERFDTQNNTLSISNPDEISSGEDEEDDDDDDDAGSQPGLGFLNSPIGGKHGKKPKGKSHLSRLKNENRDNDGASSVGGSSVVDGDKRELTIRRQYKRPDGTTFWKTEVIKNKPKLIDEYLKVKARMKKKKPTKPKNKQQEEAKLMKELERLEAQAKKGGSKNLTCGRCGEKGHMQTNLKCPMYQSNSGDEVDFDDSAQQMLSQDVSEMEGTQNLCDHSSCAGEPVRNA